MHIARLVYLLALDDEGEECDNPCVCNGENSARIFPTDECEWGSRLEPPAMGLTVPATAAVPPGTIRIVRRESLVDLEMRCDVADANGLGVENTAFSLE